MLNNKENKMKKLSKLELVAKYLKANPKATAEDIMNKFKVARAYAYTLKSNAKNMKTLPVTLDEVTEIHKEKLAKLMHNVSQGKMKTVAMISSNENIADKLDPRMPYFKEAPKADMVNHPPHYKAGGIEVIDYIESKELGYHLGNVVKYISRAGLKDGNVIQDLTKAQWYLNRAIDYHNEYHGNAS